VKQGFEDLTPRMTEKMIMKDGWIANKRRKKNQKKKIGKKQTKRNHRKPKTPFQ
jgi:hypothetical protein